MPWLVFARRRRQVCHVVLACLLFGARGVAETSPDRDLTSLSIEQLTQVKVFTASRHEEDSRVAPSSVTVITRDEIARYGWRTLADVLSSVRSFYTRYDRNYTYLGARGLLGAGAYNNRILVLINGHRVNEDVYDSGPIGREFPLDLDLIDRIEIVRGPSSSLFGTNAVYGVLNIITRRPTSTAVEISGDTSSFLGRSGRLTTTYQRGALAALLSGNLYRSAGASPLFYPEYASPDTNNGYAVNVDGDGVAETFGDVAYGNLRVQGLYFSRTKIVPTGSYGANFDDSANRTTDTRGYLEANYHRDISSATDVDLRTYYDAYRFHGYGAYGGTDPSSRYVVVAEAFADWAGTEATVGHRIGRQRITLGATYERDFRVNQRDYIAGQTPMLDDRRTSWLVGTYGEAEINLVPKVTVRAGGRLDWFDTFGGALSPRVALIYSPSSKTSLKYMFGRAFRAPNAYESYYTDDVMYIAPSRHLEPEVMHSQEVAWERTLLPWLQMTTSGFYNHMNHIIEPEADPVTGLQHYINGGTDRGRGLEFELDAKTASGFSGRTSYTFADAQDGLDKLRLVNSPLHNAKFNGTVPVSKKGFAGVELQYGSAQTSFQQTRVSPSFLTNLTLSTKPIWSGWEFSASCYNAFDRRWFATGSPELRQAEIQQDGRTYRVKISYRIGRERAQ